MGTAKQWQVKGGLNENYINKIWRINNKKRQS